MIKRFIVAAAAACCISVPLVAQQAKAPAALDTIARLPVDSAVTIGTLPNGLRYYIRVNHKPEKRAELRLVVNAGSILETDQQLGLAHFIEHMAFNGTKHFPKNDLVSYLQSIGVQFGADLNASTGFDETVYILPVPTDTPRIVDRAFEILSDWAHEQLFDSSEVVDERGVVREEWRGRKGAEDRMMREWLPVAFKGSRYAVRLPIGNEHSIMTATPSRLRKFYDAWYRPDLMAVVAVGDFDPARIEALIKRDFGSIRDPRHEEKRPTYGIPDNAAPLVAITTDKEATSSSVDLIFKRPRRSMTTVADYRRDLMAGLYLSMLNNRLSEIAQKPDAPFLGAYASKGDFFARTVEAFSLAADVKDGGIERGTAALLEEARRVDRFGFLASELERAKQNLQRAYERSYDERDKTNSASFVNEYVNNFLEQEPIPGIAWEYHAVQDLLPTITLAEVNALASRWITDSNRVVIVEAPEKPGVEVPTRARLLAVMDSAARVPVTAYTETLSSAPLVPPIRTVGHVVSERTIPAVNITEWTLSNGARVVVKPTDFKADEVLMSAYADGGTSLAADSNYMSAALASQVVALSGLGDFSRVDLSKKLAGKAAGVSASIGDNSETLSGRASPKDLETMFQLIYLEFTGARLDTAAFKAFQAQAASYIANRGSSPDEVFSDTVQVTMAQHDFRDRPLTAQTFAEVDPHDALDFFRQRFAGAAPFTFVFVGNVNLDTLKALAEKYIATLPAGQPEMWRMVSRGPPTGVVERVVHKGVEPKATTLILFTGPAAYTPQHRFDMRALTELFQIQVDRTLREKLGGTYSPGVSGSNAKVPREEYTLTVQFESSPANADTLSRTVFALIDTLQANGPSAADVEKVKEQLLREHQVEVKQNAFWVGNIAARLRYGEDPAGLDSAYTQMIEALTGAQLQAAAKEYFNTRNYAKFVLLPESTKP
ncbi:MAG TPA: insulinase family protein [Gemmatimonadaceae bacterium]